MKKIIAALDGLNLSESVTDYAIYLAKEFNAYIVACLLEEVSYHSELVKNEIWWPYYSVTDEKQYQTIAKKDEAVKNESLKKLRQKFDDAGIQYTVHKDKYIALQSLVNEGHFADLILVDENYSFSNYDHNKPSHFLRDLLTDAVCPVIIAPKKFVPIDRFVFAYDGSPSSAYAIKQFSYIFSHIKRQEIEIVLVSNDKSTSHLPNHKLLKELLKQRYPSVMQSVLRKDNAADALAEHMKTENKNCMLVMGAYKRNPVSMWVHHSTADKLISDLNVPLFITHN